VIRAIVYFPSGAQRAVEVAREPADIRRGLAGRPRVDGGMLFDMGRVAEHRFWMKDTLVALDMIFINASWIVVGVVEQATPGDETRRGVGAPSRYVLEVPGGWARRHGVAAGQRVTVVV